MAQLDKYFYFFTGTAAVVIIMYLITQVTVQPLRNSTSTLHPLNTAKPFTSGRENSTLHPLGEKTALELEDLVEECLRAANLNSIAGSPSRLERAKRNARYLYDEYRKVIPEHSLDGYGSHCWNETFSVHWDHAKYSGHLGNMTFSRIYGDRRMHQVHTPGAPGSFFPNTSFNSSIVCLPKVFLAGYYKCGTSFTHCLMEKLTFLALQLQPSETTFEKEPRIWARELYELPNKERIAKYLFYYLPALRKISEHEDHQKLVLVDATPNKIYRWPVFKGEHNLTNYCLLPSVIPKLLPGSKFIIQLREPVSMIYSYFWEICEGHPPPKASDIFHKNSMIKVNQFNNCMRDRSIPSISHACKLDTNYSTCIVQRIHLVEKCMEEIDYLDTLTVKSKFDCGNSPVAVGIYFVHVQQWLRMLPRDQFLFLTLEDTLQNTTSSVHRILQFLNLRTDIDADESLIRSCSRKKYERPHTRNDPTYKMRKDTKALLEIFFQPFNKLLFALLGKKLPWDY